MYFSGIKINNKIFQLKISMQIDTGSSENGYRSIHNILSLQLLDELDSPISQNVHDSNPKHY